VCGRSTMGKPFGLDMESSWGWETFLAGAVRARRAAAAEPRRAP
jgi:hypothetical protein